MINGINTGIETPIQLDVSKKRSFFDPFLDKLPTAVKSTIQRIGQSKFYANKKIFWPISIAFGSIFLVIIAGLIFGQKGSQRPQPAFKMPTPTPIVESLPTASPSAGPLTDMQNELNDIGNQINSLDLKQSRLQPPQVDYNIIF